MPNTMPTLNLSRAFQGFAGGVQVWMNITPRRCKVTMPGQVCQRVGVENCCPTRKTRMPERIRHEYRELAELTGLLVLSKQGGLLNMPARGCSRKHPRRFTAAALLKYFSRAFREGYLAPRVDRFSMGDIDRVAPVVLPSKPIAFLGAQSAIEQDHRRVSQHVRVSGLQRFLTALRCADALKRRVMGFEDGIADSGGRLQIGILFIFGENPFPPSLAWNQRYLCRQLIDLAPLKGEMKGTPEDLQSPIDAGYRVVRLPLLLNEGSDRFRRYLIKLRSRQWRISGQVPQLYAIVCERRRLVGKVGLDVWEEVPLNEICERRDGCPIANPYFAFSKSRLSRRLDLFGYPLVGLLCTLSELLTVESELEPPVLRSLLLVHSHSFATLLYRLLLCQPLRAGSLRAPAEFAVFAGDFLKTLDAEAFKPSFVAPLSHQTCCL